MKPTGRTVILVGAGHAHLAMIKQAHALRAMGAELLLINPGPAVYYSATSIQMLSGAAEPQQVRLPVAELIERGGGEFLAARVDKIDAEDREIWAAGRRFEFDLASVDIGSGVRLPSALAGANALTVKPFENLLEARRRVEATLAGAGRSHVVVVGAGPAGVEVSLAALALARRMGRAGRLRLSLIEQSDRILPELPDKAQAAGFDALTAAGAEIILSHRATRYDDAVITTDGGVERQADLLLYAGPPRVGPLLSESHLPTAPDGSLRVEPTLQAVGYPHLLGGGDCIRLEQGPALQRIGVYAVREGEVLLENVRRLLAGKPLGDYRPQEQFLQILNLADGRALAVRGQRVYIGRGAMWLKRWLDWRFVRTYQ